MTVYIDCNLVDLDTVLDLVIRGQLRADTKVAREVIAPEVAGEVVHEVQAIIRREDIEYLGNLRRLYTSRDIPKGAQIDGDAKYADVVERGRRPGSKPPPFMPIFRWVRIKLGPKLNLPKSAHYPVARAIQRNIGIRGIPPKRVLWRALQSHVGPEMRRSVSRHLPARRG